LNPLQQTTELRSTPWKLKKMPRPVYVSEKTWEKEERSAPEEAGPEGAVAALAAAAAAAELEL